MKVIEGRTIDLCRYIVTRESPGYSILNIDWNYWKEGIGDLRIHAEPGIHNPLVKFTYRLY